MDVRSASHRPVTRRRLLAAAGSLALAAVSLAACGGSGAIAASTTTISSSAAAGAATSAAATTSAMATTSAPSASAAASAAPTVSATALQVWGVMGGGSIQKSYDTALATFSAANPKQKAVYSAAGFAKILTAVSAGTPPDITMVPSGGTVVQYAEKGILQPLDGFIKTSKVNAADFWNLAWKENIYQGKQYAITNEADANFTLVYNKALLQQVGVNQPPATFADLDDLNGKLYQTQGGAVSRLGMLPPWLTYGAPNSLFTWFYAYGGSILDQNNPKKLAMTQPANVAALQWMKKFADLYGGYDAIQKFTATWGKGVIPVGLENALLQGYIGVAPIVASNLADVLKQAKGTKYDGAFEVALLPVAQNVAADPAWLGGWGWQMPANTKRADDAWQVVYWMNATADGTDAWAEIDGFLPSYKKSSYYTKNADNIVVGGNLKVLQSLHHVPPLLGDLAGDAWTTLLNDTMQGKADPNTALTQFTQVAQAPLDKVPTQIEGAY